MTVKLYNYKGDFRKCDKSNGLTLLLTYNALYLKEPESLRNIKLKLKYADILDRSKILEANYCYIPDLKRYYLIKPESILEQGGIVTLSLEEDDIMTYLSDVMELTAVIKRQEKASNRYLNDDKYKALEYSRIQCKEFPYGFTSQNFILAVAGV